VCRLLGFASPGAARTILLFHTISARPCKQPLMVGSTLGVYSFGLILFLQEQKKDIIIILHKRLDGASEISNFCRARLAESRAVIVFMVPEHRSCPRAADHFMHARERVLFIGTQFSNLYTAVDTPARGRVGVCVVFVCWDLCVSMCSDILGSLSL
jgi:hypothetical protein